MVKHTQIRRQISDELFECVWPFCEIGAEKVKTITFHNKSFWKVFIKFFKNLLVFFWQYFGFTHINKLWSKKNRYSPRTIARVISKNLSEFLRDSKKLLACHRCIRDSSGIIRASKQLQFTQPNIYLFNVNNRNNRKRCEKLGIKTPQWRRSGVFMVNFWHSSNLFLVFLLPTLNK